ncbi:hypothetical protein ACHABX_08595 [Nesterenkonia halotolerans]|uniref:hypothetical protein n=1 Tax=Nesterenkonia halotolerans TaxID=225325 RepID=UPI003EE489A1
MSQAQDEQPRQAHQLEDAPRTPARLTRVHAAVNLVIGVATIPCWYAALMGMGILIFGSGLVSTAGENNPAFGAVLLAVTGTLPIWAWCIFNLVYIYRNRWKFSFKYWGVSLMYWLLPVIVLSLVLLVV